MEVLNASEQLHKGQPGVCLIVGAPLKNSVQQLATCQQLSDEVDLVALLKVLLQEDDILMVHAHQNVYLLEDVFPATNKSHFRRLPFSSFMPTKMSVLLKMSSLQQKESVPSAEE